MSMLRTLLLKKALSTRLPKEYQEVEYIESTGTQHIETNYTPNADSIWEFQISDIDGGTTTPYAVLYSASTDWDFDICALTYQERWHWLGFRQMMDNYSTFAQGEWRNKNTFKIARYGLDTWYNGTKVINKSTGTPGHLSTLRFLGENRYDDGGLQYTGYRAYYFKIYEGATLIRDFVPCYRKSDNVIGMYDLANNTFYTNNGTGTFVKGPNV